MSLERAVIAANRFGLGAKPGELARIAADPQAWMLAQARPEERLPAPLAALPSTADDQRAFGEWLGRYGLATGQIQAPRLIQQRLAQRAPGQVRTDIDAEASARAFLGPRAERAILARFQTAVETDAPFRERWMHFWANHFTVSAAKVSAMAMPPSFERDVARRFAMGRFADMLIASSKHPAMLHYLDNAYSIGPNSNWGRNPSSAPRIPVVGQSSGLNENIAREILELHTLGVDGGYAQADVTDLAKILTGWSIARQGPRVATSGPLFQFNAEAHEPGPISFLGRSYNQPDIGQGEAALADLARHPSTARFIATKLARHFVSDDPPPALVERLATTFRDTDGDLSALASALILAPEAWTPLPAKFKRPEEFLISAARALPGLTLTAADLTAQLAAMGQPAYSAPGPDGWSDRGRDWSGSDALWKRIEWAGAATAGLPSTASPLARARDVLGPLSPVSERAIAGAASPQQAFSIVLLCAEFQRR